MIKKRYMTPVTETVLLDINPIMTTGSITGGFDDDEIMDSEDQGAGSHRSDWENIWEGM